MINSLKHVCVVSFKDCWQNNRGEWFSYGGFPLQMDAVGSLFESMTILITHCKARPGGIRLPEKAEIIPLRMPVGQDTRRKVSVLANLPYYLGLIAKSVKQADVVHTPVPGDIAFLGMLVSLYCRKPLIARYGSSWAVTNQTTFMNRVTKAIMRHFAGGRNVMLVTGDAEDRPAPNMRWIFATALTKTELQQIRPDLDRGLSNPPRLIYAGRLSDEKGVSFLIHAIAMLKREGISPIPHLTLAGDGPQRRQLENEVSLYECKDDIHFVGQLDRNQLSDHFLRSDACVQPSLTEGFSKAWLDAMAHGLPVLTTRVGAASSVIGEKGERGWLIPPGDIVSLKNAIQRISEDPINWSMVRRRCRDYVETRTLDDWAKQIGQICSEQWTNIVHH